MQALADAEVGQQVDRPVLQDARADSTLDVLAAARFEHDGVDAVQVKELRQHEAGRAGAHDRDLGAGHPAVSAANTS